MKKYNEATESVTVYEKIDSVVLLPSGKLIFNSSKMLVLADGEEVQESSGSSSTVIDESSDLYVSIMAEYSNVESGD
tara:strand:- start:973 stop:1203 length:231 start_codon:yes stop_codon:yes gene_type:complete